LVVGAGAATIANLQSDVGKLEIGQANTRTDIADVKAEVRIVKHDQASTQMIVGGFSARLDKFEERIGNKLDAITGQQHRGAGFIAGIMAAGTVCVGFLAFLFNLLFGGHGS